MTLTTKQLEQIEQLRLEWGLADQQVRSAVGGWAALSARAGVEREFYRRINEVCDPDHEVRSDESIAAGREWWRQVKLEAFVTLREEIKA